MMKVNDRHEFPEVWDASPYLSDKADRSEPWIYHLHGVLVHSGDLNAGHYYAFLKPKKDGDFYKFDDDRVTKAMKREALEENFGGDFAHGGQRNPYTRTLSHKRSMNAYMLVYLRASRLDKILMTDQENVEPPAHLAIKYADERAQIEKRRKEREDAHLYLGVQVATDENFRAHQGFDIVPVKSEKSKESSPAHPKYFRTLRLSTVRKFTEMVAKDMGLDPDTVRFWTMVNRQNATCRPDQPLIFPDMTMDDACSKFGNVKNVVFKLWLELAVDKDENGKPIWGDALVDTSGTLNNKPILLFVKHFDVEQQSLFGIGHFYAGWQDKVAELSPHIIELMGWEAGVGFKLFEEIRHTRLDALKPKATLAAAEIQDGDILVVQKSLPEKQVMALAEEGKYTEAKDFYEYLLNKLSVTFYNKNTMTQEDSFVLDLSKKMDYNQLAAKVGEHLGVDPTHLRFTTITATTGRPKAIVRPSQFHTLNNLFVYQTYSIYGSTYNQQQDALTYEVLEMSLSELENMKLIKLVWLPEGISKEEPYELYVPKIGTLEDVVAQLKIKASLSDEVAERLRFYETHNAKVHRQLPTDHAVGSINEFFPIYVEPVPEEEDEMGENDRLVRACHFDKDVTKTHSIPFLFLVKDGEPFSATKERLSRRTGIKGKQFEKIKFAVVARVQLTKYLADEDVLLEKLTSPDDYLGLDHMSKARSTWNRTDSIFIR
jgi:ubiquitin carboxyl-terminal hydrolase 7